MDDDTPGGVHWSFWVISAIALVWNVLGAINFIAQLSPELVAAMPETHRAIIEGRPGWAYAAFAVAVFGGVIGCLALLLRKSAALYLFIASLIGVIVQLIPHFDMIGSTITDPFEITMMIVMPFVVALFLIWYAKQAERKRWIG